MQNIEALKVDARAQGRSFEEFLTSIGQFVPMPPDGHCLYSAILYYVKSNVIKDQQRVRDLIANEIEINPDLYRDWIAIDMGNEFAPGDETARDINEKVVEVRGSAYGNAVCIMAASRVFNRNFNVISWEGSNSSYPENPNPNSPTHWLAFHGVHYDVVDISLQSDRFQQTQNTMNLVDKDGFSSYAAKGYARARYKLTIIFLVPKNCEKVTLYDSMVAAQKQGDTVFYAITYMSAELDMYRGDPFICDNYTVFASSIRLPFQRKMQEINKWRVQVMIPHLLMTTLKQTWQGIRIELLCCYGRKSILSTTLKNSWNIYAVSIRQTMTKLKSDRNGLLCIECNRECLYCNQPWHFNLRQFSKLTQGPVDGVAIFEKRIFFSSLMEPNESWSRAFYYLYLHYMTCRTPSFERELKHLYDLMDGINSANSARYYCSYLLLLVDGPDMSMSLKFSDIVNNSSYKKVLYAGSTISQRFRYGHIVHTGPPKTRSPINALLTKSSQLFLLRSKIFETVVESKVDEAKMIEILKEVLVRKIIANKTPPFILLNVCSSTIQLLELDASDIAGILKFAGSGEPVFIAGDDTDVYTCEDAMPDPVPEEDGKFLGNLVVKYPCAYNFDVDETFEDRLSAYDAISTRNYEFRFGKTKSRIAGLIENMQLVRNN